MLFPIFSTPEKDVFPFLCLFITDWKNLDISIFEYITAEKSLRVRFLSLIKTGVFRAVHVHVPWCSDRYFMGSSARHYVFLWLCNIRYSFWKLRDIRTLSWKKKAKHIEVIVCCAYVEIRCRYRSRSGCIHHDQDSTAVCWARALCRAPPFLVTFSSNLLPLFPNEGSEAETK